MSPDPPTPEPVPDESPPAGPPRMRGIFAGAAAVVATVVVLSQIMLVLTTRSNSDDVADLQAQLINLEQQVARMSGSADGLDLRVGAIEELLGAAMTQPSPETTTATTPDDVTTTTATTGPEAVSLPRFTGNNLEDPALGLAVGTLSGTEYYRGTAAAYAPEPGVGRAIMVWAHWCEHCQAEIPVVADRVDDWLVMFRNVELVTVTTAIDDSRGNPLVPYLDEGRFPFPVLVDGDGALADRLGVSGFPFWVFLDPDGVVVGRWAGELGLERLEEILGRLDELAAA